MFKNLLVLFAAVALLSGCATPGRVQRMIESGHEKMAEERFLPEFERLETLLKAVEEQSGSLEKQVQSLQVILSEELQLTAANIGNLSLALNKAQGDMGQLQVKIDEVGAGLAGQQSQIQATHDRMEAQKNTLLDALRRQKEGLSTVIELLEKLD